MKDTAILFDLDGTLLNTLEDLADATNHILERYGFPTRTLEEVRRFVGGGAKRLMAQAIPADAPEELAEEVFQAFRAYYRANFQNKTRPYDGIHEVLEVLRREGYPMAIVSNKPDVAVQPLRDFHFPGLFALGEQPGYPRKPAPDMVFRAAEVLGISPERCIYVGDSEVDVLTARNAGMECLSVLWGFRDEEEIRQAGGTYFCTAPVEIPENVRLLEEKIHGK